VPSRETRFLDHYVKRRSRDTRWEEVERRGNPREEGKRCDSIRLRSSKRLGGEEQDVGGVETSGQVLGRSEVVGGESLDVTEKKRIPAAWSRAREKCSR